MNPRTITIRLYLFFFILLNQLAGTVQADADRLKIFVSIPPQKYLVERIAGNTADVSTLTGATDNPETFEPKPGQIEALLGADIYLPLGLKAEDKWLIILSDRKPTLYIVQCCRQLMTLGDSHQHKDPHVWTDPLLSLEIARIVKNILVSSNSSQADLYEQNFIVLKEELLQLDDFITRRFLANSKNSFIVSHPAWSYFAVRYGLDQIVLEHEGREIGPRTMGEKIKQARKHSINTVFIQEQHNSAAARRVAEEINARIVFLNPLKEDHINNIKQTAILIAASLEK